MVGNAPDVLGYPWPEAERMLKEAGCAYAVERTCPTKDFFPIDENQLYVIRGQWLPDGSLKLTLAAKTVKMS
jgi:hypothetical protein